ncbi:10 kDa heat shock protein-like protein [Alternaria panax]|uniref:10 kDa heat shock protein-like protein n=1 Tax=Alternaria panax TaxID=48097 RepID=A0AAD4I7S3_9PLEO|nr:10 kDa heat shock protein-like protein [Alternaria panax]
MQSTRAWSTTTIFTPLRALQMHPQLQANQFPSQSAIKSIRSIAPLLDRILVQRIKPEAKTATGIFLPETAVKELNEAKVLAVGPGMLDKDGKRVTPSVQPGDKVLIPQFGGSPIKVGEEELSLFRDHELLAKINE